MAEHLSALSLDEAAAQAALDEAARRHLDGCEACRAEVAARRARAEALLLTPEAQRRLLAVSAQLGARPAPAGPSLWVRLAFAASLPLAAALTLFVVSPRTVERLKGGRPTVELLDDTGQATRAVRPGQRLQLAAGSGGRSHALVFTVGADGAVAQVWPASVQKAEPVPPGAKAVFMASLEVTPGSFAVHACFADAPVSAEPVEEALRRAAEKAKDDGRSPLDVVVAADEVVCAHQRVEVSE